MLIFTGNAKKIRFLREILNFIIENEMITAVNVLSVEDYLISVISSEMSATSSEEFLKAHAVISRSWLLAQIEKSNTLKKLKVKIIMPLR